MTKQDIQILKTVGFIQKTKKYKGSSFTETYTIKKTFDINGNETVEFISKKIDLQKLINSAEKNSLDQMLARHDITGNPLENLKNTLADKRQGKLFNQKGEEIDNLDNLEKKEKEHKFNTETYTKREAELNKKIAEVNKYVKEQELKYKNIGKTEAELATITTTGENNNG